MPNAVSIQSINTIPTYSDIKNLEDTDFQNSRLVRIIPGSPAVCGHGNREFSFFAREVGNSALFLCVYAHLNILYIYIYIVCMRI